MAKRWETSPFKLVRRGDSQEVSLSLSKNVHLRRAKLRKSRMDRGPLEKRRGEQRTDSSSTASEYREPDGAHGKIDQGIDRRVALSEQTIMDVEI